MNQFDIAYFGASCDTAEKNKEFAEKLDLPYPLLSDTDTKVAAAYGILRGKRSKRTTFFVDKNGKIAHIETKVDVRDHGNQVVKQLETLKFARKGATPNDPAGAVLKFDPEMAKALGADDYGMKSYVFVVLKTGKAKVEDEEKRKVIFAGHFANMSRLSKEGKLVLAGPFVEAGDKRGMYIFNVETLEEAEQLVKTDPAVKAGVFDYELTKLYCSAALMKLNELHTQVQKTKIE